MERRELEELAAWSEEVFRVGLRSQKRDEIHEAFSGWFERHVNSRPGEPIVEFREVGSSFPASYFVAVLEISNRTAVEEFRQLIALFSSYVLPAPAPGPTPGDHVDFRHGVYNGPVVGHQTNNTYASLPAGVLLTDPDRWPTVGEADLVNLGVRPTRRRSTDLGLPPYVPRDVDESLRGWVGRDGLRVITGGPFTGKSRTAWAAVLRDVDPQARVYAPTPGADLRGLPALLRDRDEAYVLWLDDLEDHLGEHGLTRGLLAELTGLGVPVVGTMSDKAYDAHRFGGGPASRLLTLARSERVSSRWSEQELGRLADLHDPLLDEAREWCGDTGVTQYLGIGAELWERWFRAGLSNSRHPHGHLVVRAATDLARCGVTGDVPRQLLEEVCRCYESPGPARQPERESFQEALDWAAERRHGVTGMLVPGAVRRVGESEETWRPYGSLVVDAGRERPKAVPFSVWRCALEGTRYDTGVRLNVRATAHTVFSARAEDGDAEAMHMLSLLSENEGTALDWLRKAVDAGKAELAEQVGEQLLGRGAAEEALPYLRAAAARRPDGPATRLVGEAHQALAEQWLRWAASGGDPAAAHQLGDLLLGRGDLSEASRYYMGAEMQGHAPIARSAAVYFLLRNEEEIAEVLLIRAAAAGDKRAARLLADSRAPRQTLDDAADYYQSDDGPLDATHLAVVLEKTGLLEEARKEYEKGHAQGDSYAPYRLALLLDKQNNPAEAALWYRKAADMGHPAAKKALAEKGLGENPATVDE
ncbi:sel1 repeat family protein [Streptomyces sp. NBC_01275]|uniref:tetratricopeptide repeat protein n=1 Tax=Streptomyces sp. NBC_01275 TaxID=2903807 RepID=UPI00224DC94A|nr:tetratricopeptide repeat protein [Streptomyces sp. NBC_01275]MCX4762674.1 sel1 repeat family protein [Streptomyces sp. NBC_01275]